jgi:hypothetical protein
MAIQTLSTEMSIDALKDDNDYTRARMTHDRDAKDLAPQFEALSARIKETRLGQWDAWEREVLAQARVDAANAALDEVTTDYARDLLYVVRDRESPRFRRYFAVAPNELVRLGLQSQIEKTRTWPALLAAETDATLSAYAERFRAAIEEGDAALEERRNAAAARATHRVEVILPLFDDVNAARQSLYGLLLQRGVERKRDRQWAASFFRHGARSTRREPGGEQ